MHKLQALQSDAPSSKPPPIVKESQLESGTRVPIRVVGLVIGRIECARLRAALADNASVVIVTSITDLRDHVLLGVPRATVIVAEPHDAEGRRAASVLRQIKDEHPGIPIIGYCEDGLVAGMQCEYDAPVELLREDCEQLLIELLRWHLINVE